MWGVTLDSHEKCSEHMPLSVHHHWHAETYRSKNTGIEGQMLLHKHWPQSIERHYVMVCPDDCRQHQNNVLCYQMMLCLLPVACRILSWRKKTDTRVSFAREVLMPCAYIVYSIYVAVVCVCEQRCVFAHKMQAWSKQHMDVVISSNLSFRHIDLASNRCRFLWVICSWRKYHVLSHMHLHVPGTPPIWWWHVALISQNHGCLSPPGHSF